MGLPLSKIGSVFLALLLVSSSLFAGGPWTPWKHKGIFISSISSNVYRRISTDTSSIYLNRRVADVTAQFYIEYGITDELTIVANLPLKYVRTGFTEQSDGEFSETLPSDKMFYIGNTELEVKYKNFQSDKFVMALAFKTEMPSPLYRNATGLRAGYDAWSMIPTIHFGVSFSERVYGQLMGGYAFRTNNYSDEWRATAEVGYKFKKPLWLALLIQAKQSINNGSRNDVDISSSNNLQTGLYVNDESYWAWSLKFAYDLTNRWGINGSLGGGFVTKYIALTPAISFGFYYDWHKSKK